MFKRNRFAKLAGLAFVAYIAAPLYFNIDEPSIRGPQNQCDKHRTDPDNDPRKIERPNDSIKVIRLTNAGEFADRCDLTNALYELNWDRERPPGSYGVAVKEGAVSLPKLVLLYVHGWKHNAAPTDSDRIEFENLVKAIRKRENGERQVVGIYVGWNAEAPLWGWFENLTFWVKKNNADRIAQSSSLTLIVTAIGSIVGADPDKRDQFIPIGHSFGARMLYSAIAQPLVTSATKAHPGFPGGTFQLIRGFADSIILLNPAIEASHYSAINSFGRGKERFDPRQPPVVITISTEGDKATRLAFPVGQLLGLARTARERTTLGNYEPFWTHDLGKGACPGNRAEKVTESFGAAGLCLRRRQSSKSDSLDGFQRRKLIPHNPFIVARTTKDIIKHHNDIWNSAFREWLVELIVSLRKEHEALQSDD